jgi:hypothetical protein
MTPCKERLIEFISQNSELYPNIKIEKKCEK